ncbi:unnamed protein product [Amoebophrya sp. A120]|nr:unnamed protein product [Amoebophrya sp. A120]|eukprot:GSA120T00022551001.1
MVLSSRAQLSALAVVLPVAAAAQIFGRVAPTNAVAKVVTTTLRAAGYLSGSAAAHRTSTSSRAQAAGAALDEHQLSGTILAQELRQHDADPEEKLLPTTSLEFVVQDFCSDEQENENENKNELSFHQNQNADVVGRASVSPLHPPSFEGQEDEHVAANYHLFSGADEPAHKMMNLVPWPANFEANSAQLPVQCEQPDWLLRKDQLVLPVNEERSFLSSVNEATSTPTSKASATTKVSATLVMTLFLGPDGPNDWKRTPPSGQTTHVAANKNLYAAADWLRALFAANVQVLRRFGHGLILRTDFTPGDFDGKTHLKSWEVDSEDCKKKNLSPADCAKQYQRLNSFFERPLMVADYLNLRKAGSGSAGDSDSSSTAPEDQQFRFTHVFTLDADAAFVSMSIDSVRLAAWNLARAGKDVFAANEDWQEEKNKAGWDQDQLCRGVNNGLLFAANTAFSRTFFRDIFAAHQRGPRAQAWEIEPTISLVCASNDQECVQNAIPRLRQHFLTTRGQFWNRGRFANDESAPLVNATATAGGAGETTHIVHYMNADGNMKIAEEDFCDPGFLVKPIQEETKVALGVCSSRKTTSQGGEESAEEVVQQLDWQPPAQSCVGQGTSKPLGSGSSVGESMSGPHSHETSKQQRRLRVEEIRVDEEADTIRAGGPPDFYLQTSPAEEETTAVELVDTSERSFSPTTEQGEAVPAASGTTGSAAVIAAAVGHDEDEMRAGTLSVFVTSSSSSHDERQPLSTTLDDDFLTATPPFCNGCCIGPASEAPANVTNIGDLSYHARCLDVHKCAAAEVPGGAGALGGTTNPDEQHDQRRRTKYAFVLTHKGVLPQPERNTTEWIDLMFPNLRSMELARQGILRQGKSATKDIEIDILLLVALNRGMTIGVDAKWWEKTVSYLQTELRRIAPTTVVKRVPWTVPEDAKFDRKESWCGEVDFIRLNAFSETDYDAVVYYDRDVELQDTGGENLLALFECVAKQDVFLTATGGLNEPINVGFFAMKPNRKLLDVALEFSKLADYSDDTGWAGSGWSPARMFLVKGNEEESRGGIGEGERGEASGGASLYLPASSSTGAIISSSSGIRSTDTDYTAGDADRTGSTTSTQQEDNLHLLREGAPGTVETSENDGSSIMGGGKDTMNTTSPSRVRNTDSNTVMLSAEGGSSSTDAHATGTRASRPGTFLFEEDEQDFLRQQQATTSMGTRTTTRHGFDSLSGKSEDQDHHLEHTTSRSSLYKRVLLDPSLVTAIRQDRDKYEAFLKKKYFVGGECGQGYFLTLLYHLSNPVVKTAYEKAGFPIENIKPFSVDRCQWNYQTNNGHVCEKIQSSCDKVIAHHKPGKEFYAPGQDVSKAGDQYGQCLKRGYKRLAAGRAAAGSFLSSTSRRSSAFLEDDSGMLNKIALNVFYYVENPDDKNSRKHFLKSFPLNLETWLLHLRSSRVEPRVIQVTDATVRTWIPDVPEQFYRLPYSQAKSDFVRYALLYYHGGIYLDGDFIVQRDLHENILEALSGATTFGGVAGINSGGGNQIQNTRKQSFFPIELLSYNSAGQNCKGMRPPNFKPTFSSNFLGATKGSLYMKRVYDLQKQTLTTPCETPEKNVCCSGLDRKKQCHIGWGGLGEGISTGGEIALAAADQEVLEQSGVGKEIRENPLGLIYRKDKTSADPDGSSSATTGLVKISSSTTSTSSTLSRNSPVTNGIQQFLTTTTGMPGRRSSSSGAINYREVYDSDQTAISENEDSEMQFKIQGIVACFQNETEFAALNPQLLGGNMTDENSEERIAFFRDVHATVKSEQEVRNALGRTAYHMFASNGLPEWHEKSCEAFATDHSTVLGKIYSSALMLQQEDHGEETTSSRNNATASTTTTLSKICTRDVMSEAVVAKSVTLHPEMSFPLVQKMPDEEAENKQGSSEVGAGHTTAPAHSVAAFVEVVVGGQEDEEEMTTDSPRARQNSGEIETDLHTASLPAPSAAAPPAAASTDEPQPQIKIMHQKSITITPAETSFLQEKVKSTAPELEVGPRPASGPDTTEKPRLLRRALDVAEDVDGLFFEGSTKMTSSSRQSERIKSIDRAGSEQEGTELLD